MTFSIILWQNLKDSHVIGQNISRIWTENKSEGFWFSYPSDLSVLMCPCHYDDKAGVVTVAMYSEFSVAVISGSSTLIGIFIFSFPANRALCSVYLRPRQQPAISPCWACLSDGDRIRAGAPWYGWFRPGRGPVVSSRRDRFRRRVSVSGENGPFVGAVV